MDEKNIVQYTETALSSVVNVTAIYTVHYFRYMQKFAFEGEKHDFWEFVYIDSGRARITADGKEFTLGQGEAYFHKPNEYHAIHTDNSFANSVILSFECDSPAMRVFENVRISPGEREKELLNLIVKESRACFTDNLGEVHIHRLHRSQDEPFGGEQLIKLYIEQLLISLYRRLSAPPDTVRPKSKNASELTDRIKEILEENVYGSVSLENIAGALFFSKTYIKQVFKKNTGQTIIQYFTALKIDEAKRLISMNRYTFTEIAYKLGYSSLHYFSRQFRRATTMSLTEYARSIKVDNVL